MVFLCVHEARHALLDSCLIRKKREEEERAKHSKNAPLPIYHAIEWSLLFPAYRWNFLCYLIAWKSCRRKASETKTGEKVLWFFSFLRKIECMLQVVKWHFTAVSSSIFFLLVRSGEYKTINNFFSLHGFFHSQAQVHGASEFSIFQQLRRNMPKAIVSAHSFSPPSDLLIFSLFPLYLPPKIVLFCSFTSQFLLNSHE